MIRMPMNIQRGSNDYDMRLKSNLNSNTIKPMVSYVSRTVQSQGIKHLLSDLTRPMAPCGVCGKH